LIFDFSLYFWFIKKEKRWYPSFLVQKYLHVFLICCLISFCLRTFSSNLFCLPAVRILILKNPHLPLQLDRDVNAALVNDAESGRRRPQKRGATYFTMRILAQAFTMTFLAEWGDRSQLTTIILAASKVSTLDKNNRNDLVHEAIIRCRTFTALSLAVLLATASAPAWL